MDGIQNILPYGVGSDLQNASSNLVDAYKRNELEKSYANLKLSDNYAAQLQDAEWKKNNFAKIL